MSRMFRPGFAALTAISALVTSLSGCTGVREYVQNGFKVGPNYCPPDAPVAEHWIDEARIRTKDDPESICRWWTVFNDPKLNYLISSAYRQNLTLREAAFRVLQARAQLAIATGKFFPETQNVSGNYTRSGGAGQAFTNNWNYNFTLNWELDFWGKLRRAIAAADDNLDASVADYDGVLVTMLGDIAQNYVRVRTDQERIRLLQLNVDDVQMEIVRRTRLRAGFDPQSGQKRPGGGLVTEDQPLVAESTLKQTQAAITQLVIDLRQSEDALCVLLGMPAVNLEKLLGTGPIPTSPPEVAIGIPADLLRRRPDVRRAERLAAAQAEQIGIAEADLYPVFTVNGTMGYQAQNFRDLFSSAAFNGSVGPSFQWNLLNYGRIVNNVRFQDAKFQELAVAYQQTLLQASREAEDGLVTFLQAQQRAKNLREAVEAQAKAVEIAKNRYLTGIGGENSFTTYTLYEQNLLSSQDASAQAVGQIAQGLIATYRALGGGWEIRVGGGPGAEETPETGPEAANSPEEVPAPLPAPAGRPGEPVPPPPAPNPPMGEEMPWPADRP